MEVFACEQKNWVLKTVISSQQPVITTDSNSEDSQTLRDWKGLKKRTYLDKMTLSIFFYFWQSIADPLR